VLRVVFDSKQASFRATVQIVLLDDAFMQVNLLYHLNSSQIIVDQHS